VRARTIAFGVAAAALAGTAVPVALSGSASAKGSSTPTTVAITKCSPNPAVIGKTVTIHGTDLTGATKLVIGQKSVVINANTAKAIKATVPTGTGVKQPVNVKVVTPSGSASQQCSFKKPAKKTPKK